MTNQQHSHTEGPVVSDEHTLGTEHYQTQALDNSWTSPRRSHPAFNVTRKDKDADRGVSPSPKRPFWERFTLVWGKEAKLGLEQQRGGFGVKGTALMVPPELFLHLTDHEHCCPF